MMSRERGKLRLFLHGSKFPKPSFLGHCNTYARVTLVPDSFLSTDVTNVELGDTEVIEDDTSPTWAKIYTFDYNKAEGLGTKFMVEVLACKGGEHPSRNDAVIGSATFASEELFLLDGRSSSKRIGKKGFIHARLEFFSHDDIATTTSVGTNTAASNDGATEDDASTSSVVNIVFQMKALRLDSGKAVPDTYFEIHRHAEVSKQLIHRSTVTCDTACPIVWEALTMDLDTLCQNDLDNLLLFSIFRRRKKNHKGLAIGSFETSLRVMLNKYTESQRGATIHAPPRCTFTVRKSTKKGDLLEDAGLVEIMECSLQCPNGGTLTGEYAIYQQQQEAQHLLKNDNQHYAAASASSIYTHQSTQQTNQVQNFADIPISTMTSAAVLPANNNAAIVQPRPTYEEYIESGNKLDMYVAIDFTSTNGDPRVPGTLHYRQETALNQYEESIIKIGNCIAKHCREKLFPVWGFGARFEGIVRPIFQCGSKAEVDEISGILEAYRYVLEAGLTMSNPRILMNILNKAASKALENYEEYQSYGIVLILTSGVAADMPSVITALKSISTLPLSVIFVGIGDADFSIFEQILNIQTNDHEWRNNTTFVHFNNCHQQGDPNAIIDETVRNFPDQFIDYFVGENIYPLTQNRET